MAKGCDVHIVASGPSAKLFDRSKVKPGSWVIACNNMVRFIEADVWITSEIATFEAACMQEPVNFAGHVIWERGTTYVSPETMLKLYSESFLRGVLWHSRVGWRPQYTFSGYGKGDCYGLWSMEQSMMDHPINNPHGEVLGTVLMPALHVAGMMLGGEGTVHIWGAEMYFPGGTQHAYDEPEPAYIDDESRLLARVCRFELVDGMPVLKPTGQYESTYFFLESSLAMRQVMAAQGKALNIIDHSGGLLDPANAQLVPIAVRGALQEVPHAAEELERPKDSGRRRTRSKDRA